MVRLSIYFVPFAAATKKALKVLLGLWSRSDSKEIRFGAYHNLRRLAMVVNPELLELLMKGLDDPQFV